MNTDNRKFAKLFIPFAEVVAELTQQFQIQRPVLFNQKFAEKFQENKQNDIENEKESYNKNLLNNELRQKMKEKQSEERRRIQTQSSLLKQSQDIEINTFNSQNKRDEKQHQTYHVQSRRDKDNKAMQQIKHIKELKQQSYQDDGQAQKKLQQIIIDNTIKKIRGEKVRDDEDRVKKSIRNQNNYKQKKTRQWNEKNSKQNAVPKE